jgi:AcrR family transcriptional regulator
VGIVERKEREKEARRTAILDAAERVFMERGFTAATMDDIAKRAELAKGTVYLYYRSKEELQLGLVHRGLELLHEAFSVGMEGKSTSIERLLTMGESYWQFANDRYFYFELLHVAELPYRPGQISEGAILTLHERSNAIWSLIIGEIENAKAEGTVQPEVSSIAVASMLWLNSTSVLRFHFRMKAMAECVWDRESNEFNMCRLDWRSIYRLNASLLLHEIVTVRGAMYLQPVEWPKDLRAAIPTNTEGSRMTDLVMSPYGIDTELRTPTRFVVSPLRELPFEHFHETGV